MTDDQRDQNDQVKDLTALFTALAGDPPETSMSSLSVMAKARGEQARAGRVRRRNWALGVAASLAILTAGAVLIPRIGSGADESVTASGPATSAAMQASSEAAAPMMQAESVPETAAMLESMEAAEGADTTAEAYSLESDASAPDAAGVAAGSAFDIAIDDVGSTASGSGGSAAELSASEQSDASGSGASGIPVSAPAPALCSLVPLAAGAVPGPDLAQVLSLRGPCGAVDGSAFAGTAGVVAIYRLPADPDPCDEFCTATPDPTVRYRSAPSGLTTVLVQGADGVIVILTPVALGSDPAALGPDVLTDLGREVLAAT